MGRWTSDEHPTGPAVSVPWGQRGLGALGEGAALLTVPFGRSAVLTNCSLSLAAKQQLFLLIKSQRGLPEAIQIGFCWNPRQLNSWEKRGEKALSRSRVSLLLY